MSEKFYALVRWYWRRFGQITKFAVVGIINTTIDFSIFLFLLYQLELSLLAANTIAYSVAVVNSFLLNRYWTFSQTSKHGDPRRQFLLFLGFNIVGLGLSNLTVWAVGAIYSGRGGTKQGKRTVRREA